MELKEKERTVIQDLRTQEKSCIEKYQTYSSLAKDPELKALFQQLSNKEQEHFQTLGRVMTVTEQTIRQKRPTKPQRNQRIKNPTVFW